MNVSFAAGLAAARLCAAIFPNDAPKAGASSIARTSSRAR
jgi:hypothetical protein